MSPQEEVSGSNSPMGPKTPLSPVCAEVRLTMDAVRDNRATTADRLFVAAHTEKCPGCASEWVFLQATKTAWSKTPMAVPPASLSARIAAATYRKPTFAERLVSAFAFLNPVPVRVAIGVAAVAGISFLALPRMSMDGKNATPVMKDQPPILAQLPQPRIAEKKQPVAVAVAPVEKPASPIQKATPKPVAPAVKEAPTVALKPVPKESERVNSDVAKSVAVVEKPTPKPAPQIIKPATLVVTKPKLMQVAINKPRSGRISTDRFSEPPSQDGRPVASEPSNHVATVAKPNVMPESKPEPKVITPETETTVAGITAPEPEPDFANGSNRIPGLKNAGMRPQGPMSGGVVRTSSAVGDGFIVSAPSKL